MTTETNGGYPGLVGMVLAPLAVGLPDWWRPAVNEVPDDQLGGWELEWDKGGRTLMMRIFPSGKWSWSAFGHLDPGVAEGAAVMSGESFQAAWSWLSGASPRLPRIHPPGR